jgi:UDP-N-acetylmuramoyl-tripeptide--D-alanyl-D-alanine ligase
MEIANLHQLFLKQPTVSTDSRNITKGCLYFALLGPHFNGNDFALQALEKGASYAVVDSLALAKHKNCIFVDHVLDCLHSLASYHRNYSNATVISLTGSNGKTTTKELIYRVLSEKYHTIATKGNLNNHIGVPLSLLSIQKNTEFAIIEMGANHQGEIAKLCQIIQPDFGCITNFGKAHLEGFGGVAGVIKGKSELYKHLMAHDKTILFQEENLIQKAALSHYPNTISFGGLKGDFITQARDIAAACVSFNFQGMDIKTQLYGHYNTTNCMIAASIGAYFKVPLAQIQSAISSYQPNNNRSEFKKIGLHSIILDAYNANPSSMEAALNHFSNLHTELSQKMVILGDMFELGDTAPEEHQATVNLLETLNIDQVILVGKLFSKTNHPFKSYPSFEDLEADKENLIPTPSLVLIKGSRGMALERVIPLLET